MQRPKKVAGAPIAMHRRGRRTDKIVLEFVRRNSGLTIRQIAKELNFSIGRVDGSINRLLKAGKVRVEHSLRRGILIKKVFGIRYRPKPKDLVEIPMDIIDEELWEKTIKVYALSRSTIGISSLEREEWDKRSLAKEEIKIKKEHKKFKFRLPKKLSEFYELENSETSLSALNDLALLTVESTILPVALPPTYPAQVSVVLERELHIHEKFVVTASNPSVKIQANPEQNETSVTLPFDFQFLPEMPKRRRVMRAHSNSETDEFVAPVEVTS